MQNQKLLLFIICLISLSLIDDGFAQNNPKFTLTALDGCADLVLKRGTLNYEGYASIVLKASGDVVACNFRLDATLNGQPTPLNSVEIEGQYGISFAAGRHGYMKFGDPDFKLQSSGSADGSVEFSITFTKGNQRIRSIRRMYQQDTGRKRAKFQHSLVLTAIEADIH